MYVCLSVCTYVLYILIYIHIASSRKYHHQPFVFDFFDLLGNVHILASTCVLPARILEDTKRRTFRPTSGPVPANLDISKSQNWLEKYSESISNIRILLSLRTQAYTKPANTSWSQVLHASKVTTPIGSKHRAHRGRRHTPKNPLGLRFHLQILGVLGFRLNLWGRR